MCAARFRTVTRASRLLVTALAILPVISADALATGTEACVAAGPPPATDAALLADWRRMERCGEGDRARAETALAVAREAIGGRPVLRVEMGESSATVILWDDGTGHLATLRLRAGGAWAVVARQDRLDATAYLDGAPPACVHEVLPYPAWLPPLPDPPTQACGSSAEPDAALAGDVVRNYLVGGWDRRETTFGGLSVRMRRELAARGIATADDFMAQFLEFHPQPPVIRRTIVGPGGATVTALVPWYQEGYAGLSTYTFELVREDGLWKVDRVTY